MDHRIIVSFLRGAPFPMGGIFLPFFEGCFPACGGLFPPCTGVSFLPAGVCLLHVCAAYLPHKKRYSSTQCRDRLRDARDFSPVSAAHCFLAPCLRDKSRERRRAVSSTREIASYFGGVFHSHPRRRLILWRGNFFLVHTGDAFTRLRGRYFLMLGIFSSRRGVVFSTHYARDASLCTWSCFLVHVGGSFLCAERRPLHAPGMYPSYNK